MKYIIIKFLDYDNNYKKGYDIYKARCIFNTPSVGRKCKLCTLKNYKYL